jgi:hypothetical protein
LSNACAAIGRVASEAMNNPRIKFDVQRMFFILGFSPQFHRRRCSCTRGFRGCGSSLNFAFHKP